MLNVFLIVVAFFLGAWAGTAFQSFIVNHFCEYDEDEDQEEEDDESEDEGAFIYDAEKSIFVNADKVNTAELRRDK